MTITWYCGTGIFIIKWKSFQAI